MSEPAASPSPAGLPAEVLALRFAKTEAGRAEIRNRALPLSRSARNLLLIIDASRPAGDWLRVVQGCDRAALQALLEAALVAAPVAAPLAGTAAATGRPSAASAVVATASTPALPAAADAAPRMSLAQALEHRSYQALYDRITAEARPRLGLFKSYRMILEVERCSGPAEIRALAQRFVDQVRDLDGDVAGMALAQVLIAPE